MDPSDSGQNGRNLVGIWWEWGWSLSKIWVGSHWNDIPTKFLPFLLFCPESTWIQVESVGEGKVLNHWLDNQWIVPYPPWPCAFLDCHMNAECAILIGSIKYPFKYVHKGPDGACYNSFTYFSPLIFPHILFACSYLMLIISCLHSYFLLQTFFSFMCSLTVYAYPHAQFCTVCLLMHSLLRHSLITQYIRTG